MSGLVEELVDQEAVDLAAMVQLPADQADPALAAMWEDTVRRGDLMQILGTAWLWSSKEVIARAACACVRTVIDRVPAANSVRYATPGRDLPGGDCHTDPRAHDRGASAALGVTVTGSRS